MTTTLEQRVFLQERLAFFGRVAFLFSASFLAIFNLIEWLEHQGTWLAWMTANRNNQFHVGSCLVLLAQWLVCRGRPLPERVLIAVEVLGFWATCLASILPVVFPEATLERKFGMLLEITILLVGRAVIVPSLPQHTLMLGVPVVAAVIAVTWTHSANTGLSGSVLKHASEAGVFTSLALGVATLASRVIYGLRKDVREARKLGQYVIETVLGKGAMGVVYRARHALLRRPTAVKLLRPDVSGEDSVLRFEREVQLTSQLTHPNTVAIYDYGRTPEGVFYYAMELLDGVNLQDLVRIEGPLPPGRAIHILRQVCSALCEAHGLGLVHRDIKPANVMLCERWAASDVVKVVDFGLVKEAASRADVTTDKVVMGTPHYMSPEAIQTPDRVGPPSDMYAVGAMAYFLVTGHTLFADGGVFEILMQQISAVPVAPSERQGRADLAPLDGPILSCLNKDPAARPDAAGLLATLEAVGTTARWTQTEARAWWTAHRGQRPAPRPADGEQDSSELPTIVVREPQQAS
jgi:eukaryotic-like serine/threonine-protein kinase